jgi:signal transduction histidine kinase
VVVAFPEQLPYVARMIFASIMLATYATSIEGLTRSPGAAAYNAAMDSIAPTLRGLSNVSPPVVDWTMAVGLTLFIQADGAGLLGADASFQGSSLSAVTALLMTVPLAWRRHYPLVVFGLVFVGLLVTFTGDVTAHAPLVWAAVIALALAAYSVGVHSRYHSLSLLVLAAVATFIVAAFGGGLPAPPDFAVPYVLLILPWLVGHALRTRQLRVDIFQERAIRLEQEQDFAMQVALAEERARIARELHDVVAHNVSVMVVQAGAARSVLDPSHEEVRGALLAVEASGHAAMAELRTMLGLLNYEGGNSSPEAAELTPQPGIGQVQPLLKRVRDASLPVELRVEGAPRPLPPGIDLAAYRIIQEALTNALKYAGLARTEVVLDYREAELKVEVLDDGPGERSAASEAHGRGLVGMRERVALYGGRLETGPRLERGYAVRAWLPLPREGG